MQEQRELLLEELVDCYQRMRMIPFLSHSMRESRQEELPNRSSRQVELNPHQYHSLDSRSLYPVQKNLPRKQELEIRPQLLEERSPRHLLVEEVQQLLRKEQSQQQVDSQV